MSERYFAVNCGTRGALPVSDVSDAELLERFVTRRDEEAFTALMARHGPMVFGLCRRLLRHAQDAEDAFQATFLILVRKAASIGRRELLGNWLYGVALRVASRARVLAAKRRTREATDMEQIALATREPAETTDVSAALVEEVQRLPAKYRRPVVLCYLEGRSNEEAADEMRCPVGTVKIRLSRAREMLRKRLIRRGVALSTAAFSAALSVEALAAPLPPALINSALKAALDFAAGDAAALGLVSGQVAALTKGVLHTMFVSKMKILAVWVLALGLVLGGTGAFFYHLPAREADAKKTDRENIQGTWKIASIKYAGSNVDKDEFRNAEIVFTADKFKKRFGDKSTETTYKIDPTANPTTVDFDIVPEEGGGRELGIYKLEGDTLTICSSNKKERPKEFESKKEGIGFVLMVLKRSK